MSGASLRCEAVTFSYGGPAMSFDLDIEAGVIVALMGPSGSGKSTLLSLVAGFERPVAGRIMIGGRDVTRDPPALRPVSMVFQENNLFGHLDAFANVALGRSPSLRLSTTDRREVTDALARVGLEGKENRLPRELSGGERQRVALARVLVRDRPVLLLDEPFAALGPALKADMLALLRELHAEHGMTILMATHDPDDARAAASELVFVDSGRIAAHGPVETFFGPDAPQAFRDYAGSAPSR